MKRIAIIAALLTALSACNTVDGIGRDISGAANTGKNTF